MNAHFTRSFGGFQRRIACRAAVVGLVVAITVSPAVASSPTGVAFSRIVTEIRELKRLVFLLKRDERKVRVEREQLARCSRYALQFANGGPSVRRTGLTALAYKFQQSPGQASMLQMHVPSLPADDFVPEPKVGFTGGDVSQLLQYCRQYKLGVRYGGHAQIVFAELARDLVNQADGRIAYIDRLIEHYKAQNVAHTDLIGHLMSCATHCHHCHSCYHHGGYGYCGHVTPLVLDHPIAGLNSKAYDTSEQYQNDAPQSGQLAATDYRRLKFLAPDAPAEKAQAALASQLAQTSDREVKSATSSESLQK